MLEFDPVLLTGIDEIDAQHRELFGRVNALLESSRSHRSREEVVRLLEFLGSYVVDHFASEERMMVEGAYPKLEGHRAEHRQLVKELEILRHELKSEGPSAIFVIRVGNRVTEWLREHIYRTDRLLGEWLKHQR
ncbi:MAG TPA: bacteriohemerythrin [Anaeromyxobacter sp.]